jgi:dihydrofolate reductase
VRKVILMMQVSLDGYGATEDHDLGWALSHVDGVVQKWMNELLIEADVHFLGRVAYEEQVSAWPGSTGETADAVNGATKVVFSTTLDPENWDDWDGTARIADLDAGGEIARLRLEDGGDIFVSGGPELARRMSADGLIDEYRLVVHPAVLGSGLPLFGDRIDLELVDTTPFPSGALGVVYRRADRTEG